MTRDIPSIHQKILKTFRNIRKRSPEFVFSLRKSDINKRLSLGYWFHGNDEYIAISFWSGMDWVRKVPNISLIIMLESGKMLLEFSSKDSPEKTQLLFETFNLVFALEIKEDYLFSHRLSPNFHENPQYALDYFISNYKDLIDETLDTNKKVFQTKQNTKNRIGFIEPIEFKKNLDRIRKYEQKKHNLDLPFSINSIEIKNFGFIDKLEVSNLPGNSQWIFVTGENSSGKTSFLKALSVAICNGNIKDGPRYRLPNKYSIRLVLNKNGKETRPVIINKAHSKEDHSYLVSGFVAYGPSRINIRDAMFAISGAGPGMPRTFSSFLSRPYNSLFNTASSLLDIGFVYTRKDRFPEDGKIYENKYSYITEIITELCPAIVDIHFGRRVEFFLTDPNNELLGKGGLKFEELSSGYRNLIAMASDMLIHLYYQQPKVTDPSELEGIVIIDEIDLHFHPRMQRDIIVKLGELFPRIQFIVSTHNPIPLLGAPTGSVFLNVKFVPKKGVVVKRLKKLEREIANLLPNTIYTSEIFGLDEIESVQNENENNIFFEDYYKDVKKDIELDKRLKEFEESNVKFPSNLFK